MLTPSLITAIRWTAITLGCVFVADSAVAGSVGSVISVGLAVLVAAWWTLRPEPVVTLLDVIATLVLAAASVLGDPLLAFVPAVVVSLAIIAVSDRIVIDEPSVDAAGAVARAMGQAAPPTVDPALVAELQVEQQRRAARLTDRVGEWLTYTQIGLDRRLARRPDNQLAELRSDITESLREIAERSRQLRAQITPLAPLSSHLSRLLEWWSDHYGAEVELDIADPSVHLAAPIEQALLLITLEAIDNAGRHSGAETLTVRWLTTGTTGSLSIADDGRGFDPASTVGAGIDSMKRTAERAGVALTIDSSPGNGTTIAAVAPRT